MDHLFLVCVKNLTFEFICFHSFTLKFAKYKKNAISFCQFSLFLFHILYRLCFIINHIIFWVVILLLFPFFVCIISTLVRIVIHLLWIMRVFFVVFFLYLFFWQIVAIVKQLFIYWHKNNRNIHKKHKDL